MSVNFSSFADFLEQTKNQDRQFLNSGELCRIPEFINALENSTGGWLITDINTQIPGLDSQIFDSPEKIKIFRVKPLSWPTLPKTLNNQIYRRVEGINLASGRLAKSFMIRDSLEISRDDYPVFDSLDENCVNEFRNRVINLHSEYKIFPPDEFLRRSFIYSGKHLTFAGALMFGNKLEIHAELNHTQKISLDAKNIWDAYTKILPRLTAKLSSQCAHAFREIFINALIHSDYNIDTHINIEIIAGPPRVIINNPGRIRTKPRNLRLQKILSLAEINTNGLESIKIYSPSFELNQDMLDFRVIASLPLEGNRAIIL